MKAAALVFLASTPIFGARDGTSLIVGPGIFAGFLAFPIAMILSRRQIRTEIGSEGHLKLLGHIGLYALANFVLLAIYAIISNIRLPTDFAVNDFAWPYLMLLLLNPAIHFFYFARRNGFTYIAACHFALIKTIIHMGICLGFMLLAGALFLAIFGWLGVASFL